LFFNSAKIAKIREAQLFRKSCILTQTHIEDKKLQNIIAREEKIRETAKKKVRKEAERATVREEIAREKA
jgi:hypothetical protein